LEDSGNGSKSPEKCLPPPGEDFCCPMNDLPSSGRLLPFGSGGIFHCPTSSLLLKYFVKI
jgi:hypothetical protein